MKQRPLIRRVLLTNKTPAKESQRASSKKNAWIAQLSGPVFTKIRALDLTPAPCEVTMENPSRLICSYNWVRGKKPLIYVPGAPARIQLRKPPLTLQLDKGRFFIDQDSYRMPRSAFEPLFRATQRMNPDFDFRAVDLISERNSLRKLYNFVAGIRDASFRIKLDLVHDTLVLTRCERKPIARARGRWDSGCGHNFESAVTRPVPGLEDSQGHYRVLNYMLGDLNAVVRFEVDAYCGPVEKQRHSSTSEQKKSQSAQGGRSEAQEGESEVQVESRGIVVPTSSTAEIKTGRTWSAPIVPSQLWFGRTPNLVVGVHKQGVFSRIDQKDMTDVLRTWEVTNQNNLRKLVRLISQLRGIVKEKGTSCVLMRYRHAKPRRLLIAVSAKRYSSHSPLPDSIVQEFWK